MTDFYVIDDFRIKVYTYLLGKDLPRSIIKERKLKGNHLDKFYKIQFLDQKAFEFLKKVIHKYYEDATYNIQDFNNVGVFGNGLFRIISIYLPKSKYEVLKVHCSYEEEYQMLMSILEKEGVVKC